VAEAEGKLPAEEKVRRSVVRTLGTGALALACLLLAGFWGSLGFFTLEPGQAAVLLRLGKHYDTVTAEGLHFTWPRPIVTLEKLNVSEVRSEEFGFRGGESEIKDAEKLLEATMQTSDNNIVRVSFAVQFSIKDAFAARFRVAQPEAVVRDAAQAAMREVVGRMTVDGVFRERRGVLASEVEYLLQDILDAYDSGIEIRRVLLQEVQPPAPVRAAFDDVVAAKQDASRLS
jgi:membrane protease subunit HflK